MEGQLKTPAANKVRGCRSVCLREHVPDHAAARSQLSASDGPRVQQSIINVFPLKRKKCVWHRPPFESVTQVVSRAAFTPATTGVVSHGAEQKELIMTSAHNSYLPAVC